jgi:hypothetical protein
MNLGSLTRVIMPTVLSTKTAAAILATVLLLDDLEEERRKKERKWCKNLFLKRNVNSHMKLLRQLRENEPRDLKNYLRWITIHTDLYWNW